MLALHGMKLRGLKLVTFLLFFSLCEAFGLSPVEQIEEFHYRKKGFDRNQDKITDFWIYTSYRHRWIKKEFDNNYDGKIDSVIERIRIKNMTRHVTYSFTKQTPIGVTYEFPERRYLFTDEDEDGYFDKFNNNGSEISVHEGVSYSLNFLLSVLENLEDQEERAYVLTKVNEKYNELERQLKTLLKNPDDEKKWERIIEKMRMYLDLPSQRTLPIILHLAKSEEDMGGNAAYVTEGNHLFFYPNAFNNVTAWLQVMDHEVLHVIEYSRDREEENEGEEIAHEETTPHVESIGISEATLYSELTAYLQEFKRSEYYKPFEDPEFSYQRLVDVMAHVALLDDYDFEPDEGDPVSYYFLKLQALENMLSFLGKHPHFNKTLGMDIKASKEDFERHYLGK